MTSISTNERRANQARLAQRHHTPSTELFRVVFIFSFHSGGSYPQPCVLRVLVADEKESSLVARTVPLRPAMTVRDVTKLLALKLRLSNPQDFTLVALVDGQGDSFLFFSLMMTDRLVFHWLLKR